MQILNRPRPVNSKLDPLAAEKAQREADCRALLELAGRAVFHDLMTAVFRHRARGCFPDGNVPYEVIHAMSWSREYTDAMRADALLQSIAAELSEPVRVN